MIPISGPPGARARSSSRAISAAGSPARSTSTARAARPTEYEAAAAIGMSRRQAMTRIILPQAMRVIIPPTGNETIAMLKDTSLLMALPLSTELFFQAQAIGNRTLKIMPTLMAACLWYLIITSVLMVGQYFLERHFGRGYGDTSEGGARRRVLQMGSTK